MSTSRTDAVVAAAKHTATTIDAARSRVSAGQQAVLSTNTLTVTTATSDPAAALAQISAEPIQASVTLTTTIGDTDVEVAVDPAGVKNVNGDVSGLAEQVDPAWYATATRAANGDPDATLSLPSEWSMVARTDLRSALASAADDIAWQILPDVDALQAFLATHPVWTLAEVFNTDRQPIFVVVDLDADVLLLGGAAIVSLRSPEHVLDAVKHVRQYQRPSVVVSETLRLVNPNTIAPTNEPTGALAGVADEFWSRAAGSAWLALATQVTVPSVGANGDAVAEIFGLQRVHHPMPRSGVPGNVGNARAALSMFNWAFHPDATDQRIAIDQVASLYREYPPWQVSADVHTAARAVCRTLRRDAVGEVLLARRSARKDAIDVARQAAERTASMVKNTAERCIASLLAVGGVIAGQSVAALTVDQAGALRLLIAVFLAGLAVWSFLFEGLPALSPLRALRSDISTTADLLEQRERDEVLQLKAVRSATRQAKIMLFALPATYLVVAVIAVWVHG